MKIFTNKFNDTFYLPITNNSSRDEQSYTVSVDDGYGILSIENTVGPVTNNLYITTPKVPSIEVAPGTLSANARSVGSFVEYTIQINAPSPLFKVYEFGKKFFLFYSDGSYANIEVDYMGETGTFPTFRIDEKSLESILTPLSLPLPTPSVPTQIPLLYFLSTESETRSFLKVSTSTSSFGAQKATVTLQSLRSIAQNVVYEFIVDPVRQPVQPVDQPPSNVKDAKTAQLSRAFIPASSVVTLQLDESGDLYMDKLSSGSSQSQGGYRRRCTSLGFEGDLVRFCSSIPKQSLFSFTDDDVSVSTTGYDGQYFTDANMGASINRETTEGFRFFAPLWLKDRVPSYFAIFRRSATNEDPELLKGASLVKLIDIKGSQLGGYLESLVKNENFSKPPLEVSIDQGYSLKWNGVSLDTGYWVNHTEFVGTDVQEGISDFEFNQILSGGFSRGLIVNPQFLNIEFLFNDNEAKLYDVYQYFGMYCDDVELSKFIPNIESTASIFNQNFTRPASDSDFNSSVISNSDGVNLVVDLNSDPDRKFNVETPSTVLINSVQVPSKYKVNVLQNTSNTKKLRVEFTSDADITAALAQGKLVRLEDENGLFVSYLTVSVSSYDEGLKKMTVGFDDNNVLLPQPSQYFIRLFDLNPDASPSLYGNLRLDSPDASQSRCLIVSKRDASGTLIEPWISSVVDQGSKFKDSLVLFNASTSAYIIVLANSIDVEQDYIKVFFDVLESNGLFDQGNEVFINVSEYDVDGAVPGPKVLNSTSRKFILKSKQNAYSIKNFEFSNYKNEIVGLISLDSKTFNLGSIVGVKSDTGIPVKEQPSPFMGLEFAFPAFFDTSLGYGDRITVEQTIGMSTKRWSVVRSENPKPSTSSTSASTTEIAIQSGTFVSNDNYTSFEIQSGSYFPVMYDRYVLTGSTASEPDVVLNFVSAEALDNGNYVLIFSDKNIKDGYGIVRVDSLDTQVTYFDYTDQSSLSTVLASSFQRFVDCPMKAATSNGRFYLYSDTRSDGLSVTLYSSYSTISRTTLNRSFLKPSVVLFDGEFIRSNYYRYEIDPPGLSIIYSTRDEYTPLLQDDTKILSRSGTPSTVEQWNNKAYSVPDIRAIVEDGEEMSLIKFSGTKQPSLLNDRIQLITNNTVSLSIMSFYDLIDLDFFEEVPVRSGIQDVLQVTAFAGEQPIFSGSSKRDTELAALNVFSMTKTISLSVDIVENMYSGWNDWQPKPLTTVFTYSQLKGTGSVAPNYFPPSWSPSYGFKIEYLNSNNQWVDYPVSLPAVNIVPTQVSSWIFNKSFVPSLTNFDLNVGVPGTIDQLDEVFNSFVFELSNTLLPATEQIRLFSEMKDFVSYCYRNIGSNNIDPSSSRARYLATFTLNIDDEHRDYRYKTQFLDGSYVVKEETSSVYDPNRNVSGVTNQTSLSNFLSSVVSADNKLKLSSGRWRKIGTTNADSTPYLINVDPLLLPYDTFVNGTEEGSSPQSFPLDWYIIAGWPLYELNIESNYEYLGKRIDIDSLASTEYDYFSDYFTVGAGDETSVNGQQRSKRSLWTEISLGSNGYTTMFKGLPISFSSPTVNIEGSKFAAVLQVENDLSVPSRISLIYNQRWNAMTLLVQININSYFIDGSITLDQLYKLRINESKTDSTQVLGPMIVFGSDTLRFNELPEGRIYTVEDVIITNETNPEIENYYEFNQYTYETVRRIESEPSLKDIELYDVDYIPNCDYTIEADIFFGTPNRTRVTLTIPKGRIRGVFDPRLGRTRTFIDGLYGDRFFAVLSDVDGSPLATYVRFDSENSVVIDGPISLPNPTLASQPTRLNYATVSVIGDSPVYRSLVDDVSASSIFKRFSNRDYQDVLIAIDAQESRSGIVLSYLKPSVLRPTNVKVGILDEFGNVSVQTVKNTSNIFRVDGGFEPSYKNIIEYAAAEDLSITRQILDSLKGYNTQIIGINDINLWYRRVSDQGVNIGRLNIRGNVVNVPYAIGRKTLSPLVNTWGEGFYSRAEDNFIDVPVSGTEDMEDDRFFLSTKIMSVPSFFRTSEFSSSRVSDGSSDQNASVRYLPTQNRLTMYIELDRIISDHLFNSGVFAFFSSIWESLSTTTSPYTLSREYIERNLLDRYYVDSIDVYTRPSTVTEVVSVIDTSGFTMVDTIGVQQKSFFEFSIPVDGSKDVSLAFNIKRT